MSRVIKIHEAINKQEQRRANWTTVRKWSIISTIPCFRPRSAIRAAETTNKVSYTLSLLKIGTYLVHLISHHRRKTWLHHHHLCLIPPHLHLHFGKCLDYISVPNSDQDRRAWRLLWEDEGTTGWRRKKIKKNETPKKTEQGFRSYTFSLIITTQTLHLCLLNRKELLEEGGERRERDRFSVFPSSAVWQKVLCSKQRLCTRWHNSRRKFCQPLDLHLQRRRRDCGPCHPNKKATHSLSLHRTTRSVIIPGWFVIRRTKQLLAGWLTDRTSLRNITLGRPAACCSSEEWEIIHYDARHLSSTSSCSKWDVVISGGEILGKFYLECDLQELNLQIDTEATVGRILITLHASYYEGDRFSGCLI